MREDTKFEKGTPSHLNSAFLGTVEPEKLSQLIISFAPNNGVQFYEELYTKWANS